MFSFSLCWVTSYSETNTRFAEADQVSSSGANFGQNPVQTRLLGQISLAASFSHIGLRLDLRSGLC